MRCLSYSLITKDISTESFIARVLVFKYLLLLERIGNSGSAKGVYCPEYRDYKHRLRLSHQQNTINWPPSKEQTQQIENNSYV